uniref:Gamma-glutamylcyclotransferase family protein n=1 Tax=Megaselia scalaris TaxID=36166 RepID=T1GP59_MEGSC
MKSAVQRMHQVFVYGTLKKGQPNHYWLTKPENGVSKFLAEGKTETKFPLVIGTRYNIPFLLDKKGSGHEIEGEIYEVDDKMMGNLDILEDYPEYYDREKQNIKLSNNEITSCWLYLIRKFPEELLQKPHLTSYKDCPEQKYCERSCRNSDIRAKDDMSFSKH